MYATDGYVEGASPKMAKMMEFYKRSPIIQALEQTPENEIKVTAFFLRQYCSSKRIPPSVKRKIITFMKQHLKDLEKAIKAEEKTVHD